MYFSTIYYNIVIWVMKLFTMWPMIIMIIFNMSTSYFHKISFHYFEDYLMTNLTFIDGSIMIVLLLWKCFESFTTFLNLHFHFYHLVTTMY
jgi:hypothetical protein